MITFVVLCGLQLHKVMGIIYIRFVTNGIFYGLVICLFYASCDLLYDSGEFDKCCQTYATIYFIHHVCASCQEQNLLFFYFIKAKFAYSNFLVRICMHYHFTQFKKPVSYVLKLKFHFAVTITCAYFCMFGTTKSNFRLVRKMGSNQLLTRYINLHCLSMLLSLNTAIKVTLLRYLPM